MTFFWTLLLYLFRKKRSPKTLDKFNPGACKILKIFYLFLHTLHTLGCDDIKHEISFELLYHVIPPGQFCHHKTQALLRLGHSTFLPQSMPSKFSSYLTLTSFTPFATLNESLLEKAAVLLMQWIPSSARHGSFCILISKVVVATASPNRASPNHATRNSLCSH